MQTGWGIDSMHRRSAWSLVLFMILLCSCSFPPGANTGRIDMGDWCDRDESMPWTGCWTEVAQLDCESGQEFEPEVIIEEFRLTSDGSFSVTWSPFEDYIDYAGPYTLSENSGTIELSLGSRAPPNAKGQGRFTVTDQGELIIRDVWLGARGRADVAAACGHRFRMEADK